MTQSVINASIKNKPVQIVYTQDQDEAMMLEDEAIVSVVIATSTMSNNNESLDQVAVKSLSSKYSPTIEGIKQSDA